MQEDIKQEIAAIIKKRFGICIDENQYDESLFSPYIGLKARDFAELVFSIEKRFEIVFEEDELLDINITSMSGLADCCYKNLQKIFTLHV